MGGVDRMEEKASLREGSFVKEKKRAGETNTI